MLALFALGAALLRAAASWYFFLKKSGLRRRLQPCRARAAHYRYGAAWLCAWFDASGLHPAPGWSARISVLAALSARFDDLRERAPHDPAPTPDAFGRSADSEGLSGELLASLRRSLPPALKADFETTLQDLFDIEAEALRADPGDGLALQRRADRKGALAVRLYALAYVGRSVAAEPTASFGAFTQRCDDILDVWFDRRDGIVTPAVFFLEKENPQALVYAWEEAWMRLTAETMRRVGGGGRRAMGIAALMAAVTRLALRRYLRAGRVQPWSERSAMVLDMSAPGNLISALGQLWRISLPDY
ncbi:MAG: hypothetical protein ACK4NS_01595 [Saprospiraceae bacterium]